MEQQVLEYAGTTPEARSARLEFRWAVASVACTGAAMGWSLSAPVRWREPFAVAGLMLGVTAIVMAILALRHAPRGRAAWTAVVAAALWVLAVGASTITFGRPRTPANKTTCASNLRQIGTAVLMYSADNRGAYPPTLGTVMVTHKLPPRVMNCPSSTETAAPGTSRPASAAALDANPGMYSSYVYVGATLSRKSPVTCVIAHERRHTHHGRPGMNVLFNDGSVRWVDEQEAKHIEAELAAGHNPPRKAAGKP
jgi:prepilin-type processing-associated H-X9-DG protein